VEDNFIDGVKAPDPQIGYGMEVKLNSSAIIRNNVVMNTKGPGIMVYGSESLATVSLIERNVTTGSRHSSGILVGGGPAVVRNNIAASNKEAGIDLQDYEKRGLLRNINVANNTLYRNGAGGIRVPEAGISRVVIINNAADAGPEVSAYPRPQIGLRMAGNVDCTSMACFVNAAQQNFSPHAASVLRGAGIFWSEAWMPRDDYFGARRTNPPTVGAIERPSPPLFLAPQP
jgi:hypothetical protein